ncbi:MAG TPA: hypothetical protein IAB12_05675 [Candidatus Ornithospirochaeta avicola]|uniref:NusG-like N-terminal domain-containing protein n=1 Tax=Candidatus Ornithospirochaeta avicola TaxID=2840896 RepID=A0A9D1PTE5_9SPIO|nr:hypothetical protein [Candidatus Ornithospirochaeta avicola]
MPYYIVHAATGKEKHAIKEMEKKADALLLPVSMKIFEKEMINTTKKGKINKRYNMLPGYLFVHSDRDLDKNELFSLTGSSGSAYRFLSYSDGRFSLKGSDEEFADNFFALRGAIKQNNVIIKEDQKVVVKSGAFIAFEGRIKKFDRRRDRVTIALNFMEKETLITLPYSDVAIKSEGLDKKEEICNNHNSDLS